MATAVRQKRYVISYDVKLPSKKLLILGIIGGWVIIALGAALLIIEIAESIARSEAYYQIDCFNNGVCTGSWLMSDGTQVSTLPHLEPWWLCYGVLLAGIVAVAITTTTFRKFYRRVSQGKITYLDTERGGFHSLDWVLWIRGNTLANELREQKRFVSAGTWHSHKVGDFIDLR